jgi:hypothetical protein
MRYVEERGQKFIKELYGPLDYTPKDYSELAYLEMLKCVIMRVTSITEI